MQRKLWFALALLACSVGLAYGADGSPVGPPASRILPPRPPSFVDFLAAGQDLVVQGTVLECQEVTRGYEESCGTHGLMPLPITEVKLRVDAVYAGVCDDSVVAISAIDHGYFRREPVGSRVIAWGNRSCDDGWKLRGRLVIVEPDGSIVGRFGLPVVDGEAMTVSVLNAQALPFASHPATIYDGAIAVALARRTDTSGWTTDGATFQLDSLGWVNGRGSHVPRTMRFPLLPGCYPDIYPGDSLLVPIPASFVGDTLDLVRCPSALRVQRGFAPGLGVRIGELQQALVRVGSTLRLRSIKQGGR